MANLKAVENEIEQLGTFKALVRAYEQIASIRMIRTREIVLKNRVFLKEINDIFDKVRLSYLYEAKKLEKKRKEKITFLSHNGKTVSIFLGASAGLYGEIVHKTFDKFAQEVESGNTEVVIVGRYGLSLFLERFPEKPYTFFDMPDGIVESRKLDKIIRHIVQYEEIHVFHGQFMNVVKQEPEMLRVSAELKTEKDGDDESMYFIFEPTLEKILKFFETQIFGSLFDQSVRENELAKFASRVMAMDQADGNTADRLRELNFKKMQITHRVKNRKQINSLAGMRYW